MNLGDQTFRFFKRGYNYRFVSILSQFVLVVDTVFQNSRCRSTLSGSHNHMREQFLRVLMVILL